MTEAEVIEVLGLCTAARPGVRLEEATPKVYHLGLADLPGEAVRAAALAWLKTNRDSRQWMPTIAELRQIVTADPLLPSAAQAWADIEAGYSPYKNSWAEVTSNPFAELAARSVFGSGRFGPEAFTPKFDAFARRDFINAYDAFAGRDQRERQLGIASGAVGELVEQLAERKRLPGGGKP